jgi:hypothetical protein
MSGSLFLALSASNLVIEARNPGEIWIGGCIDLDQMSLQRLLDDWSWFVYTAAGGCESNNRGTRIQNGHHAAAPTAQLGDRQQHLQWIAIIR